MFSQGLKFSQDLCLVFAGDLGVNQAPDVHLESSFYLRTNVHLEPECLHRAWCQLGTYVFTYGLGVHLGT